jgi:magnesium transporter
VIVDVAAYRSGKRLSVGDWSEAVAQCRQACDGFVWIGLKDPTAGELERVAAELDLHPLAVEDAVQGHQRPKLTVYLRSAFVALLTLRYVDATSDVETGEIMLFLGDRFVVTVRRGELGPLAGLRADMEQHPETLAHGPAAVLHAVMDAVVDSYTAVESELQRDLDAIEADVFDVRSRTDVSAIYLLKREVLEVKRATGPLVEPLRRLTSQDVPYVQETARPFFRDVLDNLLRVVDQIESYDRLLTDVLSAHLAQATVRQNTDMRKISAWVAIAAFPTMLAGVYGMNFEYMPELSWRYGYPATNGRKLCLVM